MPNRNREKGNRVERKVVGLIRELGWHAQRVPLSGGAGGDFLGDIHARLPSTDTTKYPHEVIECKSRKNMAGYGSVNAWLGENDYLVLDRPFTTPLVVMTWERFCGLQSILERAKAGNQGPTPDSTGHRDGHS